jgi:glycosyltransferase involved in cell wall biosynthesis
MSTNKKILFVHPWLVEAGSQKFLFEIVKHIDKSKFDIGVLCGIESPNTDSIRPETYYFKIKEIGVPLYPLIQLGLNKPATPNPAHPLLQYAKDVLKYRLGIEFKKEEKQEVSNSLAWLSACADVMKNYDKIVFVDVYLFESFQKIIDEFSIPYAFIVTGTSNQFENNYKCLSADENYDFVYFTEQIVIDIAQHLPGEHRFLHLPLATENDAVRIIEAPEDPALWNIGIFTRLHPSKHIEVFIQAFHELVASVENPSRFRLTIVGAEDDKHYAATVRSLIQFMELKDYVVFAGHSTDLVNTINQHSINIGWFHSGHDTPGYVGIELCKAGLVGVFWNISNPWKTRLHISEEHQIYAHRSISSLVNHTLMLSNDVKYRTEIGQAQQNYFSMYHNMENVIQEFEDFI